MHSSFQALFKLKSIPQDFFAPGTWWARGRLESLSPPDQTKSSPDVLDDFVEGSGDTKTHRGVDLERGESRGSVLRCTSITAYRIGSYGCDGFSQQRKLLRPTSLAFISLQISTVICSIVDPCQNL